LPISHELNHPEHYSDDEEIATSPQLSHAHTARITTTWMIEVELTLMIAPLVRPGCCGRTKRMLDRSARHFN
jgi:hypothetical protein